jgi:hypothetical protein
VDARSAAEARVAKAKNNAFGPTPGAKTNPEPAPTDLHNRSFPSWNHQTPNGVYYGESKPFSPKSPTINRNRPQAS